MPNFKKTTIKNRLHLLKSAFDNAEEILIGYQVYNLAKLDNNSIIFGDYNDTATELVGKSVVVSANENISIGTPLKVIGSKYGTDLYNEVAIGMRSSDNSTWKDYILFRKWQNGAKEGILIYSEHDIELESGRRINLSSPNINLYASQNGVNINGNTGITGDLNIIGATTLCSLDVTGAATLKSTLIVDDAATFKNGLKIHGKEKSIEFYYSNSDYSYTSKITHGKGINNGWLNIEAAALEIECVTIIGKSSKPVSFNVIGNTTIGDATNKSNLYTKGSVHIGGTGNRQSLYLNSGTIHLDSGTGNYYITSYGRTISCHASASNSMVTSVSGIIIGKEALQIESTVNMYNGTTIYGETNLKYNLNVDGVTTMKRLLLTGETGYIGFTLDVTGSANINGNLIVTEYASIGDTLDVTGATTLNSTLGVTGTTTLGSTLTVTGHTTINNDLDVLGDVEIGNSWNSYNLHVYGSCNINKDLYVTGKEAKKTLLNTTLEVRDDASFKSDVYFYTNQNDEIIKKGYISALAKEVKVNSINTTAYGINICALSNTINLLSDCNVYGDMHLYKSLTINSSLTVNDESVFKKAIYLDSGKYRYITGLEKTINCSNNSVFETGKATVNGITIGANVDYVTSINLAGHCKVYDDLTVYGNSILHNNIYLNGYTNRFITANPVDVKCGTSISNTGEIAVNGINIGSSDIASSSDYCTINLLGSCTIWKSLTVNGSNHNGTFNMYGNSFLHGTVTISSTLLVNDSVTIKGNINSDLLFGRTKVDETSGDSITRNCKLCLLYNFTDRFAITYGNKIINDKTYNGILIGDLRDGLAYDDIIISGLCRVLNTTRLDGNLILKESYTYGTNAPQNATEGQIFFEYI